MSSPQFDSEYDVLIVGSGPAGLAAARVAAREYPGRRIAVIEKGNRIAAGAVGVRSAALAHDSNSHVPHDVADIMQMAPMNTFLGPSSLVTVGHTAVFGYEISQPDQQEKFAEVLLGVPHEERNSDFVTLLGRLSPEAKIAALANIKKRVAKQGERARYPGGGVRVVLNSELDGIFRPEKLEQSVFAFIEVPQAQLDQRRAIALLAGEVMKDGVEIILGAPVEKFSVNDNGGLEGVETSTIGKISAPMVVVAGGKGTYELARTFADQPEANPSHRRAALQYVARSAIRWVAGSLPRSGQEFLTSE